MMHARHFKTPRVPFQEPCAGTGLVVDVEPVAASSTEHQFAVCPTCKQSNILTAIVPSVRRGGDWQKPTEKK